MFDHSSQAIREILEEEPAVSPLQLAAAQAEHEASGRPLADVVVEGGLMERETLLARVASRLACDLVEVVPDALPAEAVRLLTPAQARGYGVIPWRVTSRRVDLLALDPFEPTAVDDLRFALGREVRLGVADPALVDDLIRRYYGEEEAGLDGLLAELNGAEASVNEAALSPAELESLAGQAPIIRLVNLTLTQAIRAKASDIHFEPFEHEFKIRYRVDGALYEIAPPDRRLALPIISRLKVLANLNIAERRLPQDGRIRLAATDRTVDLRLSTLPTQFGESVVLRVLDQSAVQLDIGQLGLPTELRQEIETIVRRPHGIFIVTGPTGSGKTTTLYSGLRLINEPDMKILTAEDPVEYEIEGIMQVPVNPAIGLTFASALRSFLRQDPDVIMVGEIRDVETAQVAIQAALTGHLVLTTLHTNDAAGTVTRLLDMGIEPFLIASTLEGVLAQRLLRRVCSQCCTAYEPARTLLEQHGIDPATLQGRPFYRGAGCPRCHQSGYHGRVGIFEWLRLTEPIRELIQQKAPMLALRRQAVAEGMRTLREDGLRAALAGETTLEEVVKYT